MFRVEDVEEHNVFKCSGVVAKWLMISERQILEEGLKNRILNAKFFVKRNESETGWIANASHTKVYIARPSLCPKDRKNKLW